MDEARLRELDHYMIMASRSLDAWDIEETIKYLKGMHRIISGKLNNLKGGEFEELNKLFEELQKIKEEMYESKDINKTKDVWNKCNDIFIYINRLGAEHGLYFREKEDIGL